MKPTELMPKNTCLMRGAPIFLRPIKTIIRRYTALMCFSVMAGRLMAATTGPTLHLDYGAGTPLDNPVSQFMYFAPLVWQSEEITRAHCVFPALVETEIGSGEINGTKYMKWMTGLSNGVPAP